MEPFVIEGYLNLESQEGGYAAPDWTIDGSGISEDVARHFGVNAVKWEGWALLIKPPYVPGDIPIGRVRLTIERI